MRKLAFLLVAACLAGCGSEGALPDLQDAPPQNLPTVAADAAVDGPYSLADEEYDFGRIALSDPITGDTYESDIHGYISYPLDADKPAPVLLFQHGRHQTCETGFGQFPVPVGDDNCPNLAPILAPADSYRGYDYLARNLASQGYAVISIDANDINDNDSSPGNGDTGALARATLVLAHLDAFRDINAEGGQGFDHLLGKLDFSRVGLMGHSRGGEGVNRAVSLNEERENPHALKAVFALAPTDYLTQPVSDVPFATLLPYCDGDVEDLMGAFAFDNARYLREQDPAPKFQILAMGANHNYFNTVWTTDDWTIHGSDFDAHCGQQAETQARDTPAGQRALGQFFMASFFRFFVGEEEPFRGYWLGDVPVPASACPQEMAPCDDRYLLSIHPGHDHRLLIDATLDDTSLSTNALNLPVRFEGFADFGFCQPEGRSGAGCAVAEPTFSQAGLLYLQWQGEAVYRADLGALDAQGFDLLSLRVGVSHGDAENAGGQDFAIRLEDASGAQASVLAADFTHALFDPPGDAFSASGSEKTTLNAVRVPLSAFPDVDFGQLQAVELVFGQTPAGTVQITDLMLQKRLPSLADQDL